MHPLALLAQLFMLFSLIAIALTPLVLGILLCTYLRNRTCGRSLLVLSVMIVGFCGCSALAWHLFSLRWDMPFRTTLEASVNAERYGHTVEHAAENILVGVTFAGMCGALIAGGLAATGAWVWTRKK